MKLHQVLILIITLGMPLGAVSKTSAKEASEQAMKGVTIFLDVNKLNRKNLAARKMTKSHNEFAAYGYELVDVSPYTENGDLEGFFVSYKKK